MLGDVIDRYPDGIKILRQIMQMPNAKMLIGNHEYMMLKAIGHCKDAAEEKENTTQSPKLTAEDVALNALNQEILSYVN